MNIMQLSILRLIPQLLKEPQWQFVRWGKARLPFAMLPEVVILKNAPVE